MHYQNYILICHAIHMDNQLLIQRTPGIVTHILDKNSIYGISSMLSYYSIASLKIIIYWLARNQDNVSEWGGLLFQLAGTIKFQLSVLV